MKIVHVIIGLEVGGAERMLAKLAFGMDAHDHIVISLTTKGVIGAVLEQRGVAVHALNLTSPFLTPNVFIKLVRLLRSIRPDVVQTWMYHADLLGGSAARLAGVRAIVWGVRTSELPINGSRGTRLVRWICSFLSARVPARIVFPAEAARRLHESIGYKPAKCLVIPNGFDLANLRSAGGQRTEFRERLGVKPDDLLIGTVGRFHDDKDHGNFLSAAEILKRKTKLRVRFMLVGRGLDKNNSVLREWVEMRGLQEDIILLGECSNVFECMSAMDVFCLSSKTEGFPNVLGEAMGCGVPCVSTDVGDCRAVIAEYGIVVPKEDPEALASALLWMANMAPQDRNNLGAQAQVHIEEKFSIGSTCRKFEQLYCEVLERAG